jgi:hypothetical protein
LTRQTTTQELFPINTNVKNNANAMSSSIDKSSTIESTAFVFPDYFDKNVKNWGVDDVCRYLRLSDLEDISGDQIVFTRIFLEI